MKDWKSNVSSAFIECCGNVAACAKKLDINRKTLFCYIRDNPAIREELEAVRSMHSEDEIDLAVALNFKFMQDWENNPSLASQHVRFTLEKKGAIRGYHNDPRLEPEKAVNQDQIDLQHENMQLKNELAKIKSNADKL